MCSGRNESSAQMFKVNKHNQFILIIPLWCLPGRVIIWPTASLLCLFYCVCKLTKQKLVSSLWQSHKSEITLLLTDTFLFWLETYTMLSYLYSDH